VMALLSARQGGHETLTNWQTMYFAGSGSPESSVAARVGAMYVCTNSCTGSGLFMKTNGTGTTGWWLVQDTVGVGGGSADSITNNHTAPINLASDFRVAGKGTNVGPFRAESSVYVGGSQTNAGDAVRIRGSSSPIFEITSISLPQTLFADSTGIGTHSGGGQPYLVLKPEDTPSVEVTTTNVRPSNGVSGGLGEPTRPWTSADITTAAIGTVNATALNVGGVAYSTAGIDLAPGSGLSNALATISSGSRLRLGVGSYTVNPNFLNSGSEFTGATLSNKTGITIVGVPGQTIIDGSAALGELVWMPMCTNIHWSGVTFRGHTNHTLGALPAFNAQFWAGFQLYRCENVTFDNCTWENHTDHGIQDKAAESSGITFHSPPSTNNIRILNCTFRNIGSYRTNGATVGYDGSAIVPTGWTIRNCYFEDVYRAIEPFDFETGGQPFYNLVVEGCVGKNLVESFVMTAGSTNCNNGVIANNHVINDDLHTFRGTNYGTGGVPWPGIAFNISGGSGWIIRGNSVRGGWSGAYLVGNTASRCADVRIENNAAYYINRGDGVGAGFTLGSGENTGAAADSVPRLICRNNFATKTVNSGFWIQGGRDILFENNVAVDASVYQDGATYDAFMRFGSAQANNISTNMVIRNNLIVSADSARTNGYALEAGVRNGFYENNRASGFGATQLDSLKNLAALADMMVVPPTGHGSVAATNSPTAGQVLFTDGTNVYWGTVGGGALTDGDKGDITVGSGTTTLTIDAGVVTLAKMANMTADRLLGRDTAGSGSPEELAVSGGLEFSGSGGIQRSALSGDVAVSAASGTTTIQPGVVTLAKMADMTTDRLLGRDTAGTGVPEQLTVGGGIEFSGTGGIQRSALSGDVAASAASGTTTIQPGVVTYAKFQDISATQRAIGRNTGGAGDAEEVTLSQMLDWVGSAAQGDILYRNATTWTRLGAGTSGQFLKTLGTGANPAWDTPAGSGDVTAASPFGDDNRLTRTDGTGKGIQSSGVILDDSDGMTVPGLFQVSGSFSALANAVVSGSVSAVAGFHASNGGHTIGPTNTSGATNATIVLTNGPHAIWMQPSNTLTIAFASPPAAGSPPDEWWIGIANTNLTAVQVIWPLIDTRGNAPVLLSGPSTNLYTLRWNGTNLYCISLQELTTGTGPMVGQSNAVLYGATLDRYKEHRTTNYIDGNITINCSTDVSANWTNAVAGNRTVTLATPVIGTSGSLSLTSDSSARTLAILCAEATITWLSTNDTAESTNILTTASKDSLFAYRVRLKHIAGAGPLTNIQCWVKNQTP